MKIQIEFERHMACEIRPYGRTSMHPVGLEPTGTLYATELRVRNSQLFLMGLSGTTKSLFASFNCISQASNSAP